MNENLLKSLVETSDKQIVNLDAFLKTHPDTVELRNELKTLSDSGFISVVYASGDIYEISISDSIIM